MGDHHLHRQLDAESRVDYYPRFFADRDIEVVLAELELEQEYLSMYGKQVAQPRLTGWMGRSGFTAASRYRERAACTPWRVETKTIAAELEELTEATFDSVLANLYRNGKDSVSWHRDNEDYLEPGGVIAVVSFGETRTFKIRSMDRRRHFEWGLGGGDVLVMSGAGMQRDWEHSIPKEPSLRRPRLSLTFRQFKED